MNRKNYIVIHTLIASFIAPVAFMFLATGVLYTWGNKGESINTNYIIDIQQPIEPTKEAVTVFVVKQLELLGFNEPTGDSNFRTNENGFSLNWGGANLDLNFSTLPDPSKVKLDIREATLHKRMVQLHKAHGSTEFKVYASILAFSLFMLLVTGYILAWQLPKYKKLTIITSIIGVLFFCLMVWNG